MLSNEVNQTLSLLGTQRYSLWYERGFLLSLVQGNPQSSFTIYGETEAAMTFVVGVLTGRAYRCQGLSTSKNAPSLYTCRSESSIITLEVRKQTHVVNFDYIDYDL